MIRRVLLLHGIWMPGASLAQLAARLRAEGFEVEVFDYPGARGGPQQVVPRLTERLRGFDAVIAHSLGGLMTLTALRSASDLSLARVVCLGSPLVGSAAARGIAANRLTGWALGRSAQLLQRGVDAWDGATEVGVIAGCTPLGLGRVFGRFREPHDGSVAVSETRLGGIRDHVVIASSHTGLVYSAEAAALATAFLRHGRFRSDDAASA